MFTDDLMMTASLNSIKAVAVYHPNGTTDANMSLGRAMVLSNGYTIIPVSVNRPNEWDMMGMLNLKLDGTPDKVVSVGGGAYFGGPLLRANGAGEFLMTQGNTVAGSGRFKVTHAKFDGTTYSIVTNGIGYIAGGGVWGQFNDNTFIAHVQGNPGEGPVDVYFNANATVAANWLYSQNSGSFPNFMCQAPNGARWAVFNRGFCQLNSDLTTGNFFQQEQPRINVNMALASNNWPVAVGSTIPDAFGNYNAAIYCATNGPNYTTLRSCNEGSSALSFLDADFSTDGQFLYVVGRANRGTGTIDTAGIVAKIDMLAGSVVWARKLQNSFGHATALTAVRVSGNRLLLSGYSKAITGGGYSRGLLFDTPTDDFPAGSFSPSLGGLEFSVITLSMSTTAYDNTGSWVTGSRGGGSCGTEGYSPGFGGTNANTTLTPAFL